MINTALLIAVSNHQCCCISINTTLLIAFSDHYVALYDMTWDKTLNMFRMCFRNTLDSSKRLSLVSWSSSVYIEFLKRLCQSNTLSQCNVHFDNRRQDPWSAPKVTDNIMIDVKQQNESICCFNRNRYTRITSWDNKPNLSISKGVLVKPCKTNTTEIFR